MSSFDYEQHIDEIMELKERRAEYDIWRMERERERLDETLDKLIDTLSV